MRHTLAFSIAIAWLSAPTAHAQSLPVSAVETTPADAPRVSTLSASMTRARDAIDNADFAAAELALDEAVHAGLGPSDLLQWLEVSAMLAFADGRLGAMEDFLLGWASIAPTEVTVPTSMPGALRTRLNELRSEARIRVGAAPIQSFQSGVRRIAVPVQIRTDPGHLIRDLEVHVRIAEAPFAILAQGASIVVEGDVHEDARVQYFVVAHGPGGAVVATLGSEESPEETTCEGLPPSTEALTIGLVITGAAVLVGIAGVLAWGLIEDWGRDSSSVLNGPNVALRF